MPNEARAEESRQAGGIAGSKNGIRGVTRITGNTGVLRRIDETDIGWSAVTTIAMEFG